MLKSIQLHIYKILKTENRYLCAYLAFIPKCDNIYL